jgi:hypothetical protein
MNCLLKHITVGEIEGTIKMMRIWEEDVSSY